MITRPAAFATLFALALLIASAFSAHAAPVACNALPGPLTEQEITDLNAEGRIMGEEAASLRVANVVRLMPQARKLELLRSSGYTLPARLDTTCLDEAMLAYMGRFLGLDGIAVVGLSNAEVVQLVQDTLSAGAR